MIIKPDRTIWLSNIAIFAIACLLFIPFLGGVHLFDWDEINFAESAREMIKSGDYLTVRINYMPFWEKPPLFIWMQVLSMKFFGISEFAARFPNAVCGIISLLVLYNAGRKLVDTRFGLLWVLLYTGSLLPFFYFKSGIIDPWFNLFIFIGIYLFYLYLSRSGKALFNVAGSSFFIGLAILTKGPVALLVLLLTAGIFLLVKRFRIQIRLLDVFIYATVLVLTGGFWFLLQVLKGNYSILVDFIVYQIRLFRTEDAGHGGFLFYHFLVLFGGVFPASVFALPALFGSGAEASPKKDFYNWMLILFWVVLILFTVVRTKIVHYSSLCYFPLTFLAAWSFYHAKSYAFHWQKITKGLIIILGLILAISTIGITYIDHFKEYLFNHKWITDPFTKACLMTSGGWKGYEFIAGLILLAGITGFCLFWSKHHYNKALWVLNGSLPVFMFVSMLLVVPPVEAYSQRAAIEFFSSVSDQDVYLETIGYKSYVHLFYGKIRNHKHEKARDEKWLLTGSIDKTAYFSVKLSGRDKFIHEYPELEYLYEKNGFVFFKRTPTFDK
jgi:hypothetical protein